MIENEYDDGYISWKKWGDDKFGKLIAKDISDFAAEISRTKRSFSEGSRVLEVGFGNGSFLAFSKQRNWKVTGTEINKNLINIDLFLKIVIIDNVDLKIKKNKKKFKLQNLRKQ